MGLTITPKSLMALVFTTSKESPILSVSFSTMGKSPKMPMEPVKVMGEAIILVALQAM